MWIHKLKARYHRKRMLKAQDDMAISEAIARLIRMNHRDSVAYIESKAKFEYHRTLYDLYRFPIEDRYWK
ncbi:hypothetical protein [Vibrio phage BUCT194]|uniref:Uncharacterized protein n=1 Tax=Vibrio phage BUCT194 TaxID=2859072 RepID=A0AAE8XGX7_9CAUD|nr:hypothetical protein PP741_gp091 [Vibrio phage BUCT194]UAW01134.1 hypothetical protein [Vibrio phage BUCT194]